MKSFIAEDAERSAADSYEAVIASWIDRGVTLDGSNPAPETAAGDDTAPPSTAPIDDTAPPSTAPPSTAPIDDTAPPSTAPIDDTAPPSTAPIDDTAPTPRPPDPPSSGTPAASAARSSAPATSEVGRLRSHSDAEPTWLTTRALTTSGPSRPAVRVAVALAMVVCVGMVAALLVPDGDQRLDTTADTLPSSTTATVPDETGAGQLLALVEPEPTTTHRRSSTQRSSTTHLSTTHLSTTHLSTTTVPTSTRHSSTTRGPDTTSSTAGASSSASSGDDTGSGSGAGGAGGADTTSDTLHSATAESSTSTTDRSTAAHSCPNPTWRVVLRDDFNGTSLDTGNWSTLDGTGHGGNGVWRPTSVWLAGGHLNITAKMTDGQLVSGGIRSTLGQSHGRYEARVRTDPDPSETLSALITTRPASGNPTVDGQVVLYETLTAPGDRSRFRSVVSGPGGQEIITQATSATAWHTVVVEWTPAWIRVHRDGTLVSQIDGTATDLVGDGTQYLAIEFGAFASSIPHDQTMQVDHVIVSALDGC